MQDRQAFPHQRQQLFPTPFLKTAGLRMPSFIQLKGTPANLFQGDFGSLFIDRGAAGIILSLRLSRRFHYPLHPDGWFLEGWTPAGKEGQGVPPPLESLSLNPLWLSCVTARGCLLLQCSAPVGDEPDLLWRHLLAQGSLARTTQRTLCMWNIMT